MGSFMSLKHRIGRKLKVRSEWAFLKFIVFFFDPFLFNLWISFHVLNYEQILNLDAIVFDIDIDFLIFKVFVNAWKSSFPVIIG